MVDRFPIVLRGYDKDKVDEAFSTAQDTLVSLRDQIKQDDDRILQLQAELQEERSKKGNQGNSFASLGANAQQMLASAEQTSTELLARAKQDAASTRSNAQAQAETLINNAKLDAQHIVADATAKAKAATARRTRPRRPSSRPRRRTPPSCVPKPPRPCRSSARPPSWS